MVRLYLFAEGETERKFADNLLKPHLAKYSVYLHRPPLIEHARRRGRSHRGGGRNYEPMRRDIRNFLAQEKGRDVFFTTMIDLYAISPRFPRRDEAESLRHDPFRRIEFIERAFSEDIDDHRFVPYIQLHEFEAILFSDPSWFGYFYDDIEEQIAEPRAIAGRYDTPERIDDGPSSAPSKRIIAQLPDYEYDKATVGPGVAELITLETIRSKCPHFHAWLTRLEGLAP